MPHLLDKISPFMDRMFGGDTVEPHGAAEAITYTRGADSIPISAVAGQFLFAVSAPAGSARVQRNDADWLFAASLLVIGGQQTVPLRGDTITRMKNGVTEVYEVSSPTGEPEFYYHDAPANTQLRVHTKRVG